MSRGCPAPARGTLTSLKKERVLMATLRHWTPTPQVPRRCSTSDTVPMMSSTAGSLFWKKPFRKSGSCPRSRLPWGWRGRRGEGTKDSLRFLLHCPSPGPYPGLGACTVPEFLPSTVPPPCGGPHNRNGALALVRMPGAACPGQGSLLNPLRSSWGPGRINPMQAGSESFSCPMLARGPLTKSGDQAFLHPPCLHPHFWPPRGSAGPWGAGRDRGGQPSYTGATGFAHHQGVWCSSGGSSPPALQWPLPIFIPLKKQQH